MSTKSGILSNITLYAITHGLVDAACAAAIFAACGINNQDINLGVFLVVLYDVLAFALQPIAGFIVDSLQIPKKAAAAGCLLTAAASLLLRWPAAAVCTAGVGNALFHVGAGVICLNLRPGRASLAGIYVAPGALGLMLGTLMGKSGSYPAWIFILLLTSAAGLMAVISPPEIEYSNTERGKSFEHFGIILALLLVSISIRALVGLVLDFPWKADTNLLTGLTLAVMLGKAVGGVLSDRFGWMKITVAGLIASAPLISFGAVNPYLAMAGVFMFNLTMPVTLAAAANMFPGYTGFAFGLTTLALIIGSMPAFTGLRSILSQENIIFVIVLVSAFILHNGLKLYLRGEVMESKKSSYISKVLVFLCAGLLAFSKTAYADVVNPVEPIIKVAQIIFFGILLAAVIAACFFIIKRIKEKNVSK